MLTLPTNLQAERAVLGAILTDRDAIIAAAPVVGADDFSLEKYELVYRAALTCYERHTPPDLVTVAGALGSQLEAVGGYLFLTELSRETPTAVHVEYYARIVAEAAQRRRLIAAGGKISAIGYDDKRAVDVAMGDAQQVLMQAMQGGAMGATVEHVSETIEAMLPELSEDAPPALSTGFYDYDERIGGLYPSDLIIAAGRPGMGKTALACSLTLNLVRGRTPVLFFSAEMGKKQLVQRLLANLTGVPLTAIRRRQLSDEQMATLTDAFAQLSEWPLYIDDFSKGNAKTITAIRLSAMRHAAEHGRPALIIVDYLQMLDGTSSYKGNRVQEVGEVSRGLKGLAKELDCPVLALAQLNREVEKLSNKVPQLSHLRESGDIEADADLVVFIHRDAYYDTTTEKDDVAELHIAKHRNGESGVVELGWDGAHQRFQNLTRFHQAEGY